MKNIKFSVTVFVDAMNLLGGINILNEVEAAFAMGDEYFDTVHGKVLEQLPDGFESDIDDAFDDVDSEKIMKFLTVDNSGIAFDYSEAECCNDRALVAYRIPCELNTEKFLTDILGADWVDSVR